MKSKNEKISSTKDLESPSRRNAILTAGAGAVAAIGRVRRRQVPIVARTSAIGADQPARM